MSEDTARSLLRKIIAADGWVNFGHWFERPFLTLDIDKVEITEDELGLLCELEGPAA